MEEVFYKYPEKLMRASGYVSPSTGELVELTAAEKNIYVIMKKRNMFFEKHFDKQEDIAELSGVSLRQTGRILREFIASGVILGDRGENNEYKNYRYREVKNLQLFQVKGEGKTKETVMIGVVPEDFWKSDRKPDKKVTEWRQKGNQIPRAMEPLIDFDEEGVPF